MKKEITITKTNTEDSVIVTEGEDLPNIYENLREALYSELSVKVINDVQKIFKSKDEKVKGLYQTVRTVKVKINIDYEY